METQPDVMCTLHKCLLFLLKQLKPLRQKTPEMTPSVLIAVSWNISCENISEIVKRMKL